MFLDQWHDPSDVHPLAEHLNRILLGQEVVENFNTISFKKVVAISNGLFYLSDGAGYDPIYVHPVDYKK